MTDRMRLCQNCGAVVDTEADPYSLQFVYTVCVCKLCRQTVEPREIIKELDRANGDDYVDD